MNIFKWITSADDIIPGHSLIVSTFADKTEAVKLLMCDRVEAMRVVNIFYQNQMTKDAAFKLLLKILVLDQNTTARPNSMLAPDFAEAIKNMQMGSLHRKKIQDMFPGQLAASSFAADAPHMTHG